MAFKKPDFEELSLVCLVKKLTVRGTIGKTQGVKRANKPPKKPSQKITRKIIILGPKVEPKNCKKGQNN